MHVTRTIKATGPKKAPRLGSHAIQQLQHSKPKTLSNFGFCRNVEKELEFQKKLPTLLSLIQDYTLLYVAFILHSLTSM